MALDLHLECPVTLRVRDRRRNPLKRQRRVDEDGTGGTEDLSRRSSHSCSPRIPSQQKDMQNGIFFSELPLLFPIIAYL